MSKIKISLQGASPFDHLPGALSLNHTHWGQTLAVARVMYAVGRLVLKSVFWACKWFQVDNPKVRKSEGSTIRGFGNPSVR